MTGTYKATPECWEWQEKWASKEIPDEDSSCFLELRSRIEQLEAQASNYPAIPDTSTPPPAPTDEELREMWDRSLGIEHALRATYILGVAHGQSSSREVAKPARMVQLPTPSQIAECGGPCFESGREACDCGLRNDPAPVAGGLMERVAYAITGDSDGPINWKNEARAAILEVAKWLREQGLIIDADLLEQEAGR